MNSMIGNLQPGSGSGSDPSEQHHRELWATKLELMRARQLLASSLDALDVGLEIWDEQDRLVLYNKQNNRLQPGCFMPEDIGKTYESLVPVRDLRAKAQEDTLPEETWLEKMQTQRATHKEPVLRELPDDRWVNTYEALTPEGYLVVMRVNVTDLVRQGRQLEASNQQLALQSVTDSLTGLPNRRCFDEALATEWQRAARAGTSLSLLMVDIDHFKKYNDRYGHLAGDDCLRRVGQVLSRCVRRAGELVARYGGEEFVILLPSADMTHASETAQNCLNLMQQEAIPHAASPTSAQVSLSIGVACFHPDAATDVRALINAADAAMYRAKSGGRARFELATRADWDIDGDTPRTQPAPLL